jgi:hypothetical protein
MPSPLIETLLILQDRDTKRLGLEAQIKAVPRDIAAVEQKIAAEKGAIDAAKAEGGADWDNELARLEYQNANDPRRIDAENAANRWASSTWP